MLVPIGNDEGLRRIPWLTAALALLCVAVQIYQSAGGPDDAEVLAAVERRMEAEEAYQNTPEGSDDAIAAEREIEDSEHALRALADKIPIIRFGYRPVDGLSFRMVSAAFVHGGWAHLIGNLLFLWLVAGNLEDRWGRSVFLGVYLLGAIHQRTLLERNSRSKAQCPALFDRHWREWCTFAIQGPPREDAERMRSIRECLTLVASRTGTEPAWQ